MQSVFNYAKTLKGDYIAANSLLGRKPTRDDPPTASFKVCGFGKILD